MADIQILSQELADKIAAGEVAERPAAVVKELVENSLDAGATSIEVEIKSGGIEYIRVTDNGCGIPQEQAELAFMRHATSKLKSVEDLYNLGTMGFRGEALASICAVAEVELITKTKDNDEGKFLRLERGKVVENSSIPCGEGTVMVVERLFENIPARMKFLKKNSTEAGYVADILTRIALSRPDIAFDYICDGKEVFSTTGDGKLANTVLKVYGVDHAKGIVEVDYTENNISICGVVGKPELSRGNRSRQTLFVNGRYIKSAAASKIIAEGYRNSIMKGKFPFFVLDVKMPRELVDVNVHPAKTEVKFANEKEVYGILYHAVANSVKGGAKTEIKQEKINSVSVSVGKNAETLSSYTDATLNDTINSVKGDKLGFISNHSGFNKDFHSEALHGSEKKLAKEYLNNIVTRDEKDEIQELKNKNSGENNGVIYSDFNFLDEDMSDEIPKNSPENIPENRTEDNILENTVPKNADTKAYDKFSGGGVFDDRVTLNEEQSERPTYAGAWDFKTDIKKHNDFSDLGTDDPKTRMFAITEDAEKDSETEDITDNRIVNTRTESSVQESMYDAGDIEAQEAYNIVSAQEKTRIVGQIFETYVLCQSGDSFWMIDQHAAHERARFERLKEDYYSKQRMSQMLLSPIIVKLDYGETQIVLSNLDEYTKFGFDIEDFGSGSLIVNATPIIAGDKEITDLILEIADALENRGRYSVADFEERLLDMIACKYAIKANHKLNGAEMQEVADIVLRLEEKGVTTCPHGRPIRIELTKTEIEKMFKRRV